MVHVVNEIVRVFIVSDVLILIVTFKVYRAPAFNMVAYQFRCSYDNHKYEKYDVGVVVIEAVNQIIVIDIPLLRASPEYFKCSV